MTTLPAGEINTFQGNLNWVASREHSLSNPVWNGREEEFLPLCSSGESDSANLDHVAELLVRTGIEPQESLMILVPEAYDNHPHLSKNYPEVYFSHIFADPFLVGNHQEARASQPQSIGEDIRVHQRRAQSYDQATITCRQSAQEAYHSFPKRNRDNRQRAGSSFKVSQIGTSVLM